MPNRRRFLRCVAAAGATVLAAGLPGVATASPRTSAAGLGLDDPVAIAMAGGDLYIANRASDTVTVVDPSDGARVATLGRGYHLDAPSALKVIGPDLVVANGATDSVTLVSTRTRQLERVVSGVTLRHPIAVAADRYGNAYVLDAGGRVTKVDVATGRVTGTAAGRAFHFATPVRIADAGPDVFVTNSTGNSVTEIRDATMRVVRVISASGDRFSMPTGIVSRAGELWVVNSKGNSLTELSGTTGRLVQIVSNIWSWPGPIAYGDGYVFVASPPGSSPMVTQVTPGRPSKQPWMMCNTNGPYAFSNPQAMLVDGSRLWVVDTGGAGGPPGNALTEMDAASGAFINRYS